ncbi:alpha/beta hydrolase [Aestuariicella hydrocarbonica]|uniref:Alpha/beta hydrolase n=1 Tax=Pseudomaricurvus hydrocarbonicus TaxID=1470433 RepID=A0A9E5JY56_9GAMM|nr:alpha/beta hydrolase [Aestuariicella hydrocarbonica]NHO66791.1 alpha/beta hydrolase [Aestuariicella hydrocarbonica]
MSYRHILVIGFSVLLSVSTQAQPRFELHSIDRPAQPDAIPLYPDADIPSSEDREQWGNLIGQINPQVRVEARIVRNVTVPTITPVLPDPATATGTAVVVAPGGAFQSLSMDHEGFAIAQRLAEQGVTAFVLKYRLNVTPRDDHKYMQHIGKIMSDIPQGQEKTHVFEPKAPQDALQAIKLIRQNASQWNIDPEKVGIIGFSAGAMTAMHAVLDGQSDTWPAFVGYIYGPMLSVEVPAKAPPLFAALALDDLLFGHQGFGLVNAWQQAKRPVELHAYERGDHGFGAGMPGTTTTGVIDQFVAWLKMHQF